jgi:hypothetical protein
MAGSTVPGSMNPPDGPVLIPARTVGTLGRNDQGDPTVTTLHGDTAGPVGAFSDYADPNVAASVPTGGVSRLIDGTPISVGTASNAALDGGSQGKAAEYFVDPNYSDFTGPVGNGYCVPLVQFNTQVGNTGLWKEGEKLSDKPDLKPGTAIATFIAVPGSVDKVYPSKPQGNHAAFFVKYETKDGKDGVRIYDQFREYPTKKEKAELSDAELDKLYPEKNDKGERFRKRKPGERFIPFNNEGSLSNNASAFSAIKH